MLGIFNEPMSYLVLARKWRPQTFDEVVGQIHVTKTLQNAIRLQRIAHAYLFTGARGVGKTSVARILAKALNCERGIGPSSCNACSNCQEITQGNAIDVLEIDGASNRGIDSIRELRETVRYRPAKSRYKVYIIDEVHMLTTEAFNALLKTLEEPPEHVIFIFATTEPHKIPSTILSRCQRFDFRRIVTQQIVDHLKGILTHENMELSEGVLYSVAREADGSMRDAQSLLEQLLSFSGDGLSDEEILDVLGVIDRRSVLRVGDAVISHDVKACLDVVGDLYRRGIDCRRFCRQLCDHFRNLIFLSLGGADGALQIDLPEEEKNRLKEQAGRTTPESLHLSFQMIMKGEEDIKRSSLPRIALEMLLLRLTQLPSLESLEGLMDKLAELEGRLDGCSAGEAPRKEAASPRQAGAGSVSRETAPAPAGGRDESPRLRHPARDAAVHSGSAPQTDHPRESQSAEKPLPSKAMESGNDPGGNDTAGPEQSSRPIGVGGEIPAGENQVRSEQAPLSIAREEFRPTASPSGAPALSIEDAQQWPTFLQWLQNRDVILAAKLNQSVIESVSDGDVQLEVLEVFENAVKDPQALAQLTQAALEFFRREFNWTIRTRQVHEQGGAESSKSKRPKSVSTRSVMENPVVQQALELLGGELIEIRNLKSKRS
jgi:DNA polymerase-3 subunit gamma/tau